MQPIDCRRGKSWNCWCSIDAHLKDILKVIGCLTIVHIMETVSLDRQFIVSMDNNFHPTASRPPSCWFTTVHSIWAMNDVGPSRFRGFGRQFPAYRSIHKLLTYMARLPHQSGSSSFSSISMTYDKQFSKSRPCAAGLSRELCSWMNGFMQHCCDKPVETIWLIESRSKTTCSLYSSRQPWPTATWWRSLQRLGRTLLEGVITSVKHLAFEKQTDNKPKTEDRSQTMPCPELLPNDHSTTHAIGGVKHMPSPMLSSRLCCRLPLSCLPVNRSSEGDSLPRWSVIDSHTLLLGPNHGLCCLCRNWRCFAGAMLTSAWQTKWKCWS